MIMSHITPIKLGKKLVGPGEPVFIVAEIANTHEGSFETAKRMVEEIKKTGVDAVKFQYHIHEKEMLPSHPKFLTQKKRSLSYEELRGLKSIVESYGLYFLCTPFSREAADGLEEMGVDAFKIGSGEASDFSFVEHIAKKRKSMIVSTGMTSWDEIKELVGIIKKEETPFMLLHNVSVYPPPYELLNLGVIEKLRDAFGVPIGYSDHTPEIFSAIASVSFGASLIEKHFTFDRNQAGTTDHKVSLTPDEWAVMVDGIRKIEKACGDEKRIFDEEHTTMEWARHSVVTICDIKEGDVIMAHMVSTKRPLYAGIHAKDLHRTIGKRAKKRIVKDSVLHWDDIE